MIWGGCLVFYQLILLLGYRYAQLISERCNLSRYRFIHFILLFLPLLFFPGRNIPFYYEASTWPVIAQLMFHLTITVGCVFFLLSTASTLWQSYLSISNLQGRDNPYILFSVSNFGSFAALLAYPFIFELLFDLEQMQSYWRWGYISLVLLQGAVFLKLKLSTPFIHKDKQSLKTSVNPLSLITWICYSAAGVVLFMAVTNILTLDVAPIPLLWMVPLAIYLVSFYFNFKTKPFVLNKVYEWIVPFVGLSYMFFLISRTLSLGLAASFIIYAVLLFVLSMFIQRRIYMIRPAKEYLGQFYFYLSLGGFLGGVLVSWIVPAISTTLIEFPLALALMMLAVVLEGQQKGRTLCSIPLILWAVFIFIWPDIFQLITFSHALLFGVITAVIFWVCRYSVMPVMVILAVLVVFNGTVEGKWDQRKYLDRYRNYYGIGKVYENSGVRYFVHGSIIHGAEFIDRDKKGIPITYYHRQSPVAEYMSDENLKADSMATVGLGVGVMSTFMRKNQSMDFYELENDVYDVSRNYFSFLDNTEGEVSVVYGDARKTLCGASQKYGLIVEDAFTGDTIPIHLLTKEALLCYKERLEPGGVILFHVSNKYFDTGIGLLRTALELDANAAFKSTTGENYYEFKSTWIAVSWDREPIDYLVKDKQWGAVDKDWVYSKGMVWTDKRSTLLPFIKWNEIKLGN